MSLKNHVWLKAWTCSGTSIIPLLLFVSPIIRHSSLTAVTFDITFLDICHFEHQFSRHLSLLTTVFWHLSLLTGAILTVPIISLFRFFPSVSMFRSWRIIEVPLYTEIKLQWTEHKLYDLFLIMLISFCRSLNVTLTT